MSQMRMQNQIGTTLRPDVAYHMDKHVQNEIKQVGILVITYYCYCVHAHMQVLLEYHIEKPF